MRNSMLAAALSGLMLALIIAVVILHPVVLRLSNDIDELAQQEELSKRLEAENKRLLESIAQRHAIIADFLNGMSLEETRCRFRCLNDKDDSWTFLELGYPNHTQDQRLDLQLLSHVVFFEPVDSEDRAKRELGIARIEKELGVERIPTHCDQAVRGSGARKPFSE